MAATLTQGGELTYLSFPIEKMEEDEHGNVYVYGKATDGSVDSDEQIVDPDFSSKAVQDWLSTGGNVRVQHNSQRDPAGVGIEAHTGAGGDTWVKSLIVEPVAKTLVKAGALRAYSVGIARPKIVRDSVARGGRIVDGQIVEISLVDRPANKNCGIQLVKSDKDGNAEWVGKVFGSSDILTKAADTVTIDLQGTFVPSDEQISDMADKVGRRVIEKSADTIAVDLPKDVSVSFSPADLAKLLDHRRIAEQRVADGEIAEKRNMDPDVGGGVDRDKIPAADFAGRDRSFPIVTPGDVSDAASSIGRAGPSNYSSDQLKSNIIRIARRKGDAFVAELPESWKKELGVGKAEDEAALEKAKKAPKKGKKPAFEGASAPFEAKPDTTKKDNDDDEDSPDTGDDGEDDTELPFKKNPKANKSHDDDCCPNCGKDVDDDDNFCPNCGYKLMGGEMGKSISPTEMGDLIKPEKKGKPKKNRKGKTPDGGAKGSGADDMSTVPEHREPDGKYVEEFEQDAGMSDGDESREIRESETRNPALHAAMRVKSLGVPSDMGALHDLTCAAFHPDVADKAHPGHAITAIDAQAWQQKALDMAVSAPLEQAREAARMWQFALALKGADPVEIAEIRAEAHKSFRDANPGPGSFPTPTEISPTKFKRPFLSDGRAKPGADYDGPHAHAVPSDGIEAGDFDRGPLTSGHESPSPSNKGTAIIEPAPLPPGMSRTYYRNAERDAARSAMSAMHDHIAQTFPDLCPMTGPGMGGEPPTGARPVPTPVGAQKSEEEPVSKKMKKAKKEMVVKAATSIEPDLIKSAVIEATAGLVEQLAEVTKALKTERERTDKLQEAIDSLSDLPDPREAPFKGLAQNALTANKSVSGIPAGARTVAESAEQAQQAALRAMYNQWRNDPDPAQREAAESYLYKMVGLSGAINK